ncbi:MAG: PEP-CTERM sorting domain-containing protein [Desulfobacterales bacterium]|nr:PEP-CTERM sorting domain-containing protein [Desulfobacterales bacterium]
MKNIFLSPRITLVSGVGPRANAAFIPDDITVTLPPGARAAMAPIPEPGTMLFMGCGTMGLADMGRKRFQT